MSDNSEPLLRMLRDLMKRRGLNTASLAEAADLDRTRLRKILSDREPMTVDELLRIGQALRVSPGDLGLPSPTDFGEAAEPPEVPGEADDDLGLDPWGNHPEQLFRVGFELGCDFLFVADTDALEDSGVPRQVLDQFADRDLPIKLDAAYHRYNQPRYGPRAITLTLSFDALYDCTFPWAAIKQVIFFPAPPSVDEEPEEPDDDGPVLRLVE